MEVEHRVVVQHWHEKVWMIAIRFAPELNKQCVLAISG